MTFFDLSKIQRDFYLVNRSVINLATYISMCSEFPTVTPSLKTYNAFTNNSIWEPQKDNSNERVKNDWQTWIENRRATYQKPVDSSLLEIEKVCKDSGFKYYKKAAEQLYKTGLYIRSRPYKNGGGYDVFKLCVSSSSAVTSYSKFIWDISLTKENICHKSLYNFLSKTFG